MITSEHHIAKHGQGKSAYIYEESGLLVEHPSLKVRLAQEVHDEINAYCSPVPLLGYYSLMNVWKDFRQFDITPDPLEGVDNLMTSVYRARMHRKARPGEIALLKVYADCIQEQVPFIKDGWVIG